MSVYIQVSFGELIDKLTILRIKKEQITDTEKLKNIVKELSKLEAIWNDINQQHNNIDQQIDTLTQVNVQLWDIEDRLRLKESVKAFDNEFIELARAVYKTNDQRATIKKQINIMLDSELVEEILPRILKSLLITL